MTAVIARAIAFLSTLLAAGCSYYLGEPRVPHTDFRATLYGANEVPPTASAGSGSGAPGWSSQNDCGAEFASDRATLGKRSDIVSP